MNEEIQVGTTRVTFHVTAFYPPMDIAEACVYVPMYVTTGETIGNHEKGSIPAHVQKDFDKKVEPRIASVRRHAEGIIQGRRGKC